jgi:peptidoglycan hydrolase CwlO-like protein
MKEQLERRLAQLQAERQAGEKLMAELAAKQAELQGTLLRISGAIQVLQEILAQEGTPPAATDTQDPAK